MEGRSNNVQMCSQLLNMIPTERECFGKRGDERCSEENKLELRLGPPGDQDWSHAEATKHTIRRDTVTEESLLALGFLANGNRQAHQQVGGAVWFNPQNQLANASPSSFHFPSAKTANSTLQTLSVMTEESSQPCCTKVVTDMQQSAEKKAFSRPAPAITTVPNTSQKRTAPGPVVGWPPIRSFRKNLACSSNSKAVLESQNENPNKKVAAEKPVETGNKGLFVKINMDGVPIGRKVDLKAYDSYDKLSTAVDELFRDLLAAQKESSTGGIVNKQDEEKAITGILDGSGEYTLVYEDYEGDRMLVGDVPWHMFLSTVKRLRVLKSCEVSALSSSNDKQGKAEK